MATLTAIQIPCCLCGTMIYPNAANQCTTCLSHHFNLQEYIQRPSASRTGNTSSSTTSDPDNKIVIYQCRNCRRFQRTEKCWESADHESSQLMSICLKQVPALQNNYHHSSSTSNNSNNKDAGSSESIGPLKLIDTQWIWTEPHCMRYKIRCTIQTELYNVRVQQRVIVLLHCVFKNCPDCTREYNHQTWQSVVQIRQKVTSLDQVAIVVGRNNTSNNRQQQQQQLQQQSNGLMVLETALAKHKEIRKHVIKMDRVVGNSTITTNMGYDFYFASVPHGNIFVSFLQRMIPMRVRTSKKMVSSDPHSKNVAHMKHTTMCDIVPFSIYDLVVIHKSTKNCKLSGHLVLITKLASVIHMIDAAPKRLHIHSNNSKQTQLEDVYSSSSSSALHVMEVSADTYYKQEKLYRILQSSNRLIRFVVLDVELITSSFRNDNNADIDYNDDDDDTVISSATTNTTTTTTGRWKQQQRQQQYSMAEVVVARESDMGQNDDTYTVMTHLGRQIDVGDIVLGYDLLSSTTSIFDSNDANNSIESSFYHNFTMPDIVLVTKASDAIVPISKSVGDEEGEDRKHRKLKQRGTATARRGTKKNKDGKRTRELVQRAQRMGFIPEEEGGDDDDDDDNVFGDMDKVQEENVVASDEYYDEYEGNYNHLNIDDEVIALEREFELLSQQQQQASTEDNEDDNNNDFEEIEYEL